MKKSALICTTVQLKWTYLLHRSSGRLRRTFLESQFALLLCHFTVVMGGEGDNIFWPIHAGGGGGQGHGPCVKVLSWTWWLHNTPQLKNRQVRAQVPLVSQSCCSQPLALRNRSRQVVINYWWVCHPNCALSSDHSQPFVWQRMPYKIFMHHLASLSLSFFSRNIIALDAFRHFPKIFFSKGLKEAVYEICRMSE